MRLKCPDCKQHTVKVTHFKKQNPHNFRSKDTGILICEECGWKDVIR